MIPAKNAFFVIDSKATGTMTMTSKPAFDSKNEAKKFAESCGGQVVAFQDALRLAKQGIPAEKPMLFKRRLKKGVIFEPIDDKDTCTVGGMVPVRYPKNKCRIITKDRKVYHFCSTHCLFEFLNDTTKYVKTAAKPLKIRVKDYPTGILDRWRDGVLCRWFSSTGTDGLRGFCI